MQRLVERVKNGEDSEELARRIQEKLERTGLTQQGLAYTLSAQSLTANANLLDDLPSHRDVAWKLHFGPRSKRLYAEEWIEVLDGAMIFFNPYTEKVESWRDPVSITRTKYPLHLPTHGNQNKSTFSREPEGIEARVWESGVGTLESAKRMFLYGRFAKPVGTLPDGKESSLVKLHVDRAVKNKGYYVEYHGYPFQESRVDPRVRERIPLVG